MGCNIMNFSTTSSSSSLKGLCSPIPNNNHNHNHNQKNKLQKALSSSSFSLISSSSSNVFPLRSSSSRPFSHSSMVFIYCLISFYLLDIEID